MKKRKAIISSMLVLITLVTSLTSCGESSEIKSLLKEGKYDSAVEKFNQLENVDSNLSEIFTESAENLYKDFKAGKIDYDEVKDSLNTLLSIHDQSATSDLNDISVKIEKLNDSNKAFEKAKLFESEKNYEEAISQYSSVIEEDSNYEEAVSRIDYCTDTYKNETIASAKEYAEKKDYENALTVLENVSAVIKDDEEITDLIEVYTESCVNEAIKKADQFIIAKKLDDAEKALKAVPVAVLSNEKIDSKLEQIENLRPVPLEDVHVIDSYYYNYNEGSFIDSFGNTYVGVHFFSELDYVHYTGGGPYAIFNLNDSFTTFRGSIVASENTYSHSSYYVNIYADNKLIFTKTKIKKTTGKINFKVNVSKCKQLTIKMGEETDILASGHELGIVNAMLEKQ